MFINIKWGTNLQFPKFSVEISSAEGKDPFISINGCRIANGPNGEFVAMPSTKNEKTGKYWNHAYASPEFNKYILEKAKESQPVAPAPVAPAPKSKPIDNGSFSDMEDSIPF